MTNTETYIDIIKTAAEAVVYGTDNAHILHETMQMDEVDKRTDSFTFPFSVLDRPIYQRGGINESRRDQVKISGLVYIFTNIVQLGAFIEEKGPLVQLAEELKEKLLQKILLDDRLVSQSLEYESEEILDTVLNEHNPCGVWCKITLTIQKSVPC